MAALSGSELRAEEGGGLELAASSRPCGWRVCQMLGHLREGQTSPGGFTVWADAGGDRSQSNHVSLLLQLNVCFCGSQGWGWVCFVLFDNHIWNYLANSLSNEFSATKLSQWELSLIVYLKSIQIGYKEFSLQREPKP